MILELFASLLWPISTITFSNQRHNKLPLQWCCRLLLGSVIGANIETYMDNNTKKFVFCIKANEESNPDILHYMIKQINIFQNWFKKYKFYYD